MTSRMIVAIGFFVSLIGTYAHAEKPHKLKWHSNFGIAREQIQAERLPMLLFVTADNCRFCEKMKYETYSDLAVVSEIQGSFVPATIKGPSRQDLIRHYGVKIYPTTILLSPEEDVLATIGGYVNSDTLRFQLLKAKRQVRTAFR